MLTSHSTDAQKKNVVFFWHSQNAKKNKKTRWNIPDNPVSGPDTPRFQVFLPKLCKMGVQIQHI